MRCCRQAKWGNVGADKAGAQHVGTGMGLGGIKGRNMRGSSRNLAARRRIAVVKVIAQRQSNALEQFVAVAVYR